jgi:DNA-binding NtrC family response regulator
MGKRPLEILLVEDDLQLADMMGGFLRESMQVSVTHVSSAADALREELTTRHGLIFTSLALADEDGLNLVRALREHNDCPVVLLADSPTVEEAIEAMRLGVCDILNKPFEMEYLASVVKHTAGHDRIRRRERSRHRRLRKLVARIICERRDLARRIDLICHDFVQAHRRLAEKVNESGILNHQRD